MSFSFYADENLSYKLIRELKERSIFDREL